MKKKCYQKTIAKLAIASFGVFLFGITEVFSVPSTPVYADTSFNDQGFICRICDHNPDEAILVAVNNRRNNRFETPDPHHFAKRVVIPEFVFFNDKRYSVTKIENNRGQYSSLFSNPDAVTEVVIPASVKIIDNNAFYGMSNLRGVNFQFNSKLQKIGAYAFTDCRSLKSIYPPDKVEEIGDSAFKNTGVASVRLPEKLATVGKMVFSDSANLTDLDIPEGVKTIGDDMFSDSPKLRDVNFPSSLQSIGNRAFLQSGIREARLPDSVVSLGERIFYSSDLKSIKFPQGLKIIPKCICFNTKKLSEVIFPENFQEIGECAFAFTESLETVILPPTVENIGRGAYCNCGNLRILVMPHGLKEIGEDSFASCNSLKEISLPSSLEKVRKHAFADCLSLRSVVVEQGSNQPTTFERKVFKRCKRLTSFTANKPISFADPIHLEDGVTVFQNQNCPLNQNGFFVPRKWLSSPSNE